MSWIRETKKTWAQSLALRTIKNGPIPKHLAFIMDGNRRYAKRNNFDRAKGHLMGFDKLAEVCTHLTIDCSSHPTHILLMFYFVTLPKTNFDVLQNRFSLYKEVFFLL